MARELAGAIIGANGLVGTEIFRLLLRKNLPIVGTYHARTGRGYRQLDITDAPAVDQFFKDFAPRTIFHCANLAGGVDFCEKNREAAAQFHLEALKRIGEKCRVSGSTLVVISTDYVFDGLNGPYREDDPTHPLNYYGQLKLEAERWIQANLAKYLIVRTTNVYGWDPETATPNFVMSLYRSLKEGKQFRAPSYLWGNPTYVSDLATAIIELWSRRSQGVFHVVGPDLINRYDWALEAASAIGLDRGLIQEVKDPPEGMVPRPLKSWLDTEKFVSHYKAKLHNFHDGFAIMRMAMREGPF